MAALEARGEDRVILVWRTDALNQPPTVIGSTTMKIQAVQFVKNDVLAVTLWQPYDFRAGERPINTFVQKLFLTDLQGRNWREPLPLPTARSDAEAQEQSRTSPTVLDLLVNDPDNILVVNNVGSEAGDVYRVNVHTNRAERILRQEDRVSGYATDLQGNIRARIKTGTDGVGAYVAAEFRPVGGAWSEHFRSYVRTRDQTDIIGFTADPNIALIRSNAGRDKAAIYEYDINAHARREVLFEHRFFEAINVRQTRWAGPNFGEIQGLVYGGPREDDIQWTSPRYQALDTAIRQALHITTEPLTLVDPANGERATIQYNSQLYYDIVSSTPDLSTMVISLEGPSRPRAYYLLRNGQLSLLSETYPQIDRASLGTTTMVYYQARDGLNIPAFLTTPSADLCGPGPYRTVIHPHGGPWARDAMRFDYSMWVPLMASRCIAVLRPQYRGSDGWSRRLWMAGDAEWGGKMQDDLDDAARWLIDTHVAQAGHIAVFGFSYGGYASMAAAVRPNGLYRCAIAGAGVSDIRRIWRDFYTNPFYRDAQGPTVSGLSPLDQAQNIQIPIMVYGGRRDQTVPIEQSQMFVARARRSNQTVVYHEMGDYAHGPAWTRAIFGEQLGYIDEYFAQGCGPGGL